MRSIQSDIAELGLFAKRSDLLTRGYGDHDLHLALVAGIIIRVRSGWYSLPSAPLEAIHAWRIGGRLTGLSALRTYGIWTPETRKLHVTVPTDARGLRRPTDMRAPLAAYDGYRYRVSWTDSSSDRIPPFVWRVSIVDALVHILNNHDRVTSIVCLDAALHSGSEGDDGIVESDLDDIFARSPLRAQSWRAEVDGRAEAGGETEFRLKALAAGIPFVPQPRVRGAGRLDGQIGPSTFIEVDGDEWHNNPVAFKRDHDRDALVASMNGRVLRFSYELFRQRWGTCERAMRNALEDDYRRAKSTEFPEFLARIEPRKLPRRRNLRRFLATPQSEQSAAG